MVGAMSESPPNDPSPAQPDAPAADSEVIPVEVEAPAKADGTPAAEPAATSIVGSAELLNASEDVLVDVSMPWKRPGGG